MDDELMIAAPGDEVFVNLLDLAADLRGRVAPHALGRRLPAMIAALLRAAGLRARHGSATVVLDEKGLPAGAKGWAVLAGEPEEGEAIELSRRLGPARLLAFGELGPELTTGMTLKLHVLERQNAEPVLELSRRFYTEETAGVAHDLARSLAALEGREEDVARLDPGVVFGTSNSKALLRLQRGLDALEAIDAGLAGAELAPAATLLVEALEVDPDCAPARRLLVTALARLAEEQPGDVVLGLWSEERPEDPLPLLTRGELLASLPGGLGEAQRLLEHAEARFADDARVSALLGGILVQLGDHDAAEARYRRALELRPDDPALLSNLALVLSHLGRVSAAEPLARRAVELSPHDLICRQVLGHVRKKN